VPTNEISIEATGSGEIYIFLDDQKESSGRLTLEEGNIIASFFKGAAGRHEVKLHITSVNNLEIHNLCFR
jgi:arabinoxylan arabinofuranohydrolase